MRSIRIFRHYMRPSLLALAVIEMPVLWLSFYLGNQLAWWSESDAILIGQGIFVAVVMQLSMVAMGLYEARFRGGLIGSALRIVIALLIGAGLIAAASFVVPDLFLFRRTLALTIVFAFVGLFSVRLISVKVAPRIFRRRVLVLGTSERARGALASQDAEFDVVGAIAIPGEEQGSGNWKLISGDKPLRKIAPELQIDEIVLAPQDRNSRLPVDQLLDCKMAGVEVTDLMGFIEKERGLVSLDLVTPTWVLSSDGFRTSSVSIALKRIFDVLTSLVLLLVLGPIMIAAGLAVLLEGGFNGPIIYRQTRVGERGKPFEVLKFRSMMPDAEADGKARWATQNDSRITRVGRFMRKSRIDELPQIFNVLKGDMSFVGPRPERPEFVADLASKHDYYAERHLVKPGVTGWAQLSYPYGNTENDALRKLEYDLYYIKNYSLFLDFLILLETVEVVLFRKGAV